MLIRDTEFVVFDLETTGLNPELGHRVCEIGAVKIKDYKVVSSFQKLINPQRNIPEEVINIHGITNSQVAQAPCFGEVADEFSAFIGQNTLLAYNLKFDLSFLKYEFSLLNRTFSYDKCIDVLFMCRRLLKGLPKYNLSWIAEFFDLNPSVRHRAYQDAELAGLVFLKLINLLEDLSVDKFNDLYSIFGYNKEIGKTKNLEKISKIRYAIKLKTRLFIKYYSISNNQVKEYKIFPLKIENKGLNTILVSKSLRKSPKKINFNLDRILDLGII